MTVESSFLDP